MKRPDLQLTDLLISAGLSSESVAQVAEQSKRTGMPLGRALVYAGLLTDKNVECVMRLHAIYRGCSIPAQVVIDACKYGLVENMSAEQALAQAGFAAQIVSYSRLGTLLVDAGLISKDQFDEAQKTSYETRLPLGRMLIMLGAITNEQLDLALHLQQRMRSREISKDEALSNLAATRKAAPPQSVAADSAASAPINKAEKINLGELLMVSGIISEADANEAFERTLKTDKSLADTLAEMMIVPPPVMAIALDLQVAVNDGDLCFEAAAESLSYIHEHQ